MQGNVQSFTIPSIPIFNFINKTAIYIATGTNHFALNIVFDCPTLIKICSPRMMMDAIPLTEWEVCCAATTATTSTVAVVGVSAERKCPMLYRVGSNTNNTGIRPCGTMVAGHTDGRMEV